MPRVRSASARHAAAFARAVSAANASPRRGSRAGSAGLATGQVAIVTVLSSLQSAIAVGLACALLGEHLARHQWLGVAVIVAGLGLVRLG